MISDIFRVQFLWEEYESDHKLQLSKGEEEKNFHRKRRHWNGSWSIKNKFYFHATFCRLNFMSIFMDGYKNYFNIAVPELGSLLEIRNLCHNNVRVD